MRNLQSGLMFPNYNSNVLVIEQEKFWSYEIKREIANADASHLDCL